MFNKRNAFLFFFFSHASNVVWHYCSSHTTMPDRMQHATPHSPSPTTTSQILPWPSMSTDLKPKQTHLERVGETCSRQPLQMCVSCGQTTVNNCAPKPLYHPYKRYAIKLPIEMFQKFAKQFQGKAVQSKTLWPNLNKIDEITLLP